MTHLLATYKVKQFKLTLSMLKNSIQKKYQKAPEKGKKKEFCGRKWDRKSFVVWWTLCIPRDRAWGIKLTLTQWGEYLHLSLSCPLSESRFSVFWALVSCSPAELDPGFSVGIYVSKCALSTVKPAFSIKAKGCSTWHITGN